LETIKTHLEDDDDLDVISRLVDKLKIAL
jgi:hypothetical protein